MNQEIQKLLAEIERLERFIKERLFAGKKEVLTSFDSEVPFSITPSPQEIVANHPVDVAIASLKEILRSLQCLAVSAVRAYQAVSEDMITLQDPRSVDLLLAADVAKQYGTKLIIEPNESSI